MALTTVTTVTATGKKRPLCSCSWEGQDHRDAKSAWKEADRHAFREHKQIRPKPWEKP